MKTGTPPAGSAKFIVRDITGSVPSKECETEEQALAWCAHLTEWRPNARPVIEPEIQTTTSNSTQPAGNPEPFTAQSLAAALARAIFAAGNEGTSMCRRIQFKLGHWPNERSGGGYSENALRDFLTVKLLEFGVPAGTDPQRK